MRAQSLWADLQSIPDSLFNFQGDSSKRFIRKVQPAWGVLEVGARLACSKRDSRPTQRFSSRSKEFKAKAEQRKIRSRSQGSAKEVVHTSRNIKTTHRSNEQ